MSIDYASLDQITERYPKGCTVRFDDTSKARGIVTGYIWGGWDWVLIVWSGDEKLEWHPGNVTRIEQVCRWEEV